MQNLIDNLKFGTRVLIEGKEYVVKTKTWYSIYEDNTLSYIKCILSNNRTLLIIPADNLTYLDKEIDSKKYKELSENEILYNNTVFKKIGEGHQFVTNIEFGDINQIEGECIYKNYEANGNNISLGILPEKGNIRADVYSHLINLNDIKFIS